MTASLVIQTWFQGWTALSCLRTLLISTSRSFFQRENTFIATMCEFQTWMMLRKHSTSISKTWQKTRLWTFKQKWLRENWLSCLTTHGAKLVKAVSSLWTSIWTVKFKLQAASKFWTSLCTLLSLSFSNWSTELRSNKETKARNFVTIFLATASCCPPSLPATWT